MPPRAFCRCGCLRRGRGSPSRGSLRSGRRRPLGHTYASNNTSSGEINDLGAFYTDENGQFQLTGLRDGWHKVTEQEPPTGYAIKEATQEVYIKSGTGKVLTFENIPLSALVVWKYDMVTKVYAHILDEDRKVNAQKFESAFYANPDLRGVQAPAEPAPALDVQSIILQLQQSPELLSVLTSLISNQGCK